MIKYIIFAIIGIFAIFAQWLCMTEINGIRAIFQWPSVAAFLAYMNPFFDKAQTAKVAIAVVSRLENFEQRLAIRQTWKRLVNTEETGFYFVMPEHPCPIGKLF